MSKNMSFQKLIAELCNKNKNDQHSFNKLLDDIVIDDNAAAPINPLQGILVNPSTGYQVILTDSSIYNPFVIDNRLAEFSRQKTKGCRTDLDKAKIIFDWCSSNLSYDHKRIRNKNRYFQNKATEVYKDKSGICVDMAFLYITMARSVGIISRYVEVLVDYKNRRVDHACASIHLQNRVILADPAYHSFDVKHKSYRIVEDAKAAEVYTAFRR